MFLSQFLRESGNKIIWNLYEDETILISAFNAENFMKIRLGMTLRECFENKWFYMKYIGKYLSGEILFVEACFSNPHDLNVSLNAGLNSCQQKYYDYM